MTTNTVRDEWTGRAMLPADERDVPMRFSLQRAASVARKEFLHIIRDPTTLFLTLFIPIVELFMLGYAIDTNVRDVHTVVYDQARTQESRALIRAFENSGDFLIVKEVFDDEALTREIVAGRARAAIKVPEDYSRRLLAGETAQVLVMVDGSVSSVAAETVNVGNAIALRESLFKLLENRKLPIEVRPQVLFNPDTRSANFFIPGMLAVLCQMMAVVLTANAVVREKERGTIETLFMTPVLATELMLGKLFPYLILTMVDFCGIAFIMWSVFRVPIHGDVLTLLAMGFPFILTMLGTGLYISTRASSRESAEQAAMGTVIPCIFLSGYIFPIDSMPLGFWYFSQLIPTTWMIDAARGVIIRGAGWADLWPHAVILWSMALGTLSGAVLIFRKRL